MGTQMLDEVELDDQVEEVDENTWGRLRVDVSSFDIPSMHLKEDVITIGRVDAAMITVPDKHVSSQHCQLHKDRESGVVWAVDSSMCGTFINGEKLIKGVKTRLRPGDILALVIPPRTKTPEQSHSFLFTEPVLKSDLICKGKINERYEVLEQLGMGAFATVRRAVNKDTGEVVAVKIVLRKQAMMDDHTWDLHVAEAEMLQKLTHPRIVRLIELFKREEEIYMVTEFAAGGELFDIIVNEGVYNEERAQLVMKRLCDAVQYLHSKGIVHRDLKPENILLGKKGDSLDVKIADFGVAKELEKGCKTLVGSYSYIAPEVLQRKNTVHGKGRYDQGADVWSLGVVLYVMLSGRFPFAATEDMEMYDQLNTILEFKDDFWKGISDNGKDFIRRLFEIDPAKRITAAQAVDHAWLCNVHDPNLPIPDSASCTSATSASASATTGTVGVCGETAATGVTGGLSTVLEGNDEEMSIASKQASAAAVVDTADKKGDATNVDSKVEEETRQDMSLVVEDSIVTDTTGASDTTDNGVTPEKSNKKVVDANATANGDVVTNENGDADCDNNSNNNNNNNNNKNEKEDKKDEDEEEEEKKDVKMKEEGEKDGEDDQSTQGTKRKQTPSPTKGTPKKAPKTPTPSTRTTPSRRSKRTRT